MGYFRAVAVDLDGTLTEDGRLSQGAMSAIKASRDDIKMILVTGRILAEMQATFPGLECEFDAVVTENGAMVHTPSGTRRLAAPPDPAIAHALAQRGVATRAGGVLLALDAHHAATAVEVISDLGLDCQVARNRGAAMILPAGVTKGTGLLAALEELGLSAHNVIAAGDAENDLALLQAAEVGAAVASAVPSLAAHADLRLGSPGGSGVAELLTGPLITGQQRLCPRRRWLQAGTYDDGQPVLVPGSQGSILIAGDTGAGKSYLAGLLAEQWIDAGYSVLVVDPEGDHTGLAHRPRVHLIDAATYLPAPTDLLAIARPGPGSLVLDLSGLPEPDAVAYLRRLPAAIAAERAQYGIPHWVITDEAHLSLGDNGTPGSGTAEPGTCMVTWRPGALTTGFRESVDLTFTITAPPPAAAEASMTAARASVSAGTQPPRPFTIAHRLSPHVRHQHKYATALLPPQSRFYFHTSGGEASAANLGEFAHHITHCDPSVLSYHLPRGDFSRWITGTLADRGLGATLATIERDLSHRYAAELERARRRIIQAITTRYPGTGHPR